MGSSFVSVLKEKFPALSTETLEVLDRYRELVLEENQKQNLTRITGAEEFARGHILDCVEFCENFGGLGIDFADLGSGCGVPGMVAKIICPRDPWTLIESERLKAEFLERAVQTLELPGITVFSGRIESWLQENTVDSVVSRAVGPVERIHRWIRECSTWNNLILFKGPRWEEEWEKFQKTKFRSELELHAEHRYRTDADAPERRIVWLKRVQVGQ